MPDFQIPQPDGTTATVTLPDGYSVNTPTGPAEGFVTAAAHAQGIQNAGATGSALRAQLLKDPGFFRAAAKEHGVELGADGRPIQPAAEVDAAALKEAWRKEEVEPLQARLAAKERFERNTQLIEAAREAGVADIYLKPNGVREDGSPGDPLVIALLSPYVREVDGRLQVIVNGAPVTAANPVHGGSAFAGAPEGLKKLAQTDALKPFLTPEAPPQQGPGWTQGGAPAAATPEQAAAAKQSQLAGAF